VSSSNNSEDNENGDNPPNEMKRLSSNIAMCLDSVHFTRKLIEDYLKLFEVSLSEIGEDGNELIRRQFLSG
jgi:hypothetical protein